MAEKIFKSNFKAGLIDGGGRLVKTGKKMVTLKDIAEVTGFSVNTVSHALKSKPDISPKTQERIKEVAEQLGYIGNSSASFLRSGISKTIAVIVGDISNPHFSIMFKEIERYLRKSGYTAFVLNTDEQKDMEKQAIMLAMGKNVDGIIICPSPGGEDNIRFLALHQIPFVLIGRHLTGVKTNYVVCDDENGGYLAVKYLLEQGHKRILFLNGSQKISSSRERRRGYLRANQQAGVVCDLGLIQSIPVTMGTNHDKIRKIIRAERDCTAILAFSDMIAWEVIYALNQMNCQVPADYSVIGFDNIQSKFVFPVLLTTVSSSKTSMAKQAVDVILKHIYHPEVELDQIVLKTKLVIRESVKKL